MSHDSGVFPVDQFEGDDLKGQIVSESHIVHAQHMFYDLINFLFYMFCLLN